MPDVKLLACHFSGNNSKILPEYITEVLLHSWRDDTRQSYDGKITLWITFCDEWKIYYMQPSVTEILKFHYLLKLKGFSCSIINSVRSALSAFITLEGFEAGKHPLLFRYMKG